METSSLLRHHHRHPPPLRCFPLSISTDSRLRFLPLRPRSLAPISARRFKFDHPTNLNYNDDYGFSDRAKRRRRRRTKRSRQRWFDGENESEPSMLNQVIDSLLFIKVLKSYGWLLPVVLLSILLTSGLTIFVLAFSIPLGFSFIILAFDKISTWLERNKRREEDDQEEEEESQANRIRYKNNGSVHKGTSNSKFGGWDELIREEEEQRDRSSRPDQKAQELQSNIMQTRERELPLLSKLLVALFPFLATWTSLFR